MNAGTHGPPLKPVAPFTLRQPPWVNLPGSEMMNERERVTWLFVRGDETIRVNRSANRLAVAASGPGHDRRVFRFADEVTAVEFLNLYERFLVDGGWSLQAFVERRSREVENVVPDRRAPPLVH